MFDKKQNFSKHLRKFRLVLSFVQVILVVFVQTSASVSTQHADIKAPTDAGDEGFRDIIVLYLNMKNTPAKLTKQHISLPSSANGNIPNSSFDEGHDAVPLSKHRSWLWQA
ncbi:hypothetical protein CEXT_784671 [Caerostris extrusa]|uniref:Uncharacterized protein n=1 Tax=Caerostris extrusa TaxID=172846 RepID=A0AAV4R5C0_CAEEX|nr:hypothetical protein CEXT_784671 [Caerostris extrusa]